MIRHCRDQRISPKPLLHICATCDVGVKGHEHDIERLLVETTIEIAWRSFDQLKLDVWAFIADFYEGIAEWTKGKGGMNPDGE